MKKINQINSVLFLMILTLGISGCSTQGILAIGSDDTLPKITNVKHVVDKSSVGFEWPAIKDPRIKGIKVYRAIPRNTQDQRYVKIATIDNRYTTHFVDNNVAPNQEYLYTFTSYVLLHESLPGSIIRVKTRPAFAPIEFVKVYSSDTGVIKLLWSPHPNPGISGYIIERKVSGSRWKYLASIRGRLMPEYIDKSAAIGKKYSYRVVAKSNAGVRSVPSDAANIVAK